MNEVHLKLVISKQKVGEDRHAVKVATLTKVVEQDINPAGAMRLHVDGHDFYLSGRSHTAQDKSKIWYEGVGTELVKDKYDHPIEKEIRDKLRKYKELDWKEIE